MMWTYMLIGLSIGARIILYDGSPFHPNLVDYLKFIDTQKSVVTMLALRHIELDIA
jgi:acyl-coenzyme A synthetase/AMP-(fatty) acid ligase